MPTIKLSENTPPETAYWIKAVVSNLEKSIENVAKASGFGTVTVQINFKNGQIEYYKVADEIVTHKQEMRLLLDRV